MLRRTIQILHRLNDDGAIWATRAISGVASVVPVSPAALLDEKATIDALITLVSPPVVEHPGVSQEGGCGGKGGAGDASKTIVTCYRQN